ncbi:PEP-CTERM sorting domain-containing protein [Roseibacillus persicicus]|uniref:PEP-CTERM sorting domain-containing protein n=1 Tax=Roseibacillus persicicus TaxID=454148 RepID=UPI001679B9EE|nr:PEP-CTERM sorting domain-containing protein [Roseibacillus persicicus]
MCSRVQKGVQRPALWPLNRSVLACLLPAVFALSTAQAQSATVQIDWGTSTVAQKIITSTGAPISQPEFSIELGAFALGFTPTASNYSEWVNNWMVFDAVTSPDTDTSGAGGTQADAFISVGVNSRFVGTGFLETGQTSTSEDSNGTDVFAAGEQAYVFIRNSDTPDENAEWLLYTSSVDNSWEFPQAEGGQSQFPATWYVSEADQAIWGAVNGTVTGGGPHTDTSTDFVLRTHTFVPEPSSFFLLFIGLGASLTRRSRSLA